MYNYISISLILGGAGILQECRKMFFLNLVDLYLVTVLCSITSFGLAEREFKDCHTLLKQSLINTYKMIAVLCHR